MLKAYASYFVSYLLHHLKDIKNVQRIVLFGSVAREEETKESDIDLFIEVTNITKKFESEVQRIEEEFYRSREASLFKLKGVDNEFTIKIGKLTDWKDLYQSIASTGVTLYGPYEPGELPSGVRHYVIIFWDGAGKNRGAFLNKVYGFNVRGKHYEGLLEKYHGNRLGKSCIILSVQYQKEILNLIHKYHIKAKVMEVYR